MRRGLFLLCAGIAVNLLVVACIPDEMETSPSVTVQKLYYPDSGPCWMTLESTDGGGPQVAFSSGLDGPGTACSPPPEAQRTCQLSLVGGLDQVRLLVGYDNAPVTPGNPAPPPAVIETIDGVGVDAGASVTATPGSPQTFIDSYEATFAAPSQAVDELLLGVNVTQGYASPLLGPFTVIAPTVSIDAGPCNSSECASLGDGGASAPLSFTEVTAFIPSLLPAAVTFTTRIDGINQPGTYVVQANIPAMGPVQDGCGNDLTVNGFKALGAVPTPPLTAGQTWELCAQWGGSETQCFPGPTSASQMVVPTVTVENCAGVCGNTKTDCFQSAGAGQVVVDVSVPGSVPTQATLLSTLNDVLQGTPQTVQLTTQTFDGGMSSMMASVNVTAPSVPSPSGVTMAHEWVLTAVSGGGTSAPAPITLGLATVTTVGQLSQPGCASPPCAGLGPVSIGIEITPFMSSGMSAPQNVVLTSIAGGVLQASQMVTVTNIEEACGTLTGTAVVPVPSLPGATWEILSQFGSATPKQFLSPGTIQVPEIDLALDCGGTVLPVPTFPTCASFSKICAAAGATPGSVITLKVTAPAELAEQTVSYSVVPLGNGGTGGGGSGGAGGGSGQTSGGTGGAQSGQMMLGLSASGLEADLPITVPTSGYWQVNAVVGGIAVQACFE